MSNATNRALTSNVSIPYVGFGTYLVSDEEAKDAVHEALRAGYRHVDTAEFYKNEVGVGEGIRRAMQSEGLSRDDIFVTTKLWPGNAAWGDTPKTEKTTITSLEASLDRLGMDYVDLYLIHATFDRSERIAQWRGLVELQRRGKARAIGVSNFSELHLEDLEAAGLPRPAANQIELHPWSQKKALIRYLTKNAITPIAYSSLVPLETWRTAEGHASGKTAAMRAEGSQARSPFKAMAERHGVTEAQILLRWAVQSGYPVLPKTTKVARMRVNADVFSFALTADEMAEIDEMDRGDGIAWGAMDPTKTP
jgi:2,5-diketo-D-gluconate reductase A